MDAAPVVCEVQAEHPGSGQRGPEQHSPERRSPERSCVACRRKRPQGEFLRLTRQDGVWVVPQGHRSGRGSYLCADTPACWTEKRLKRTFGAQAAALSQHLLERQASRESPNPYASSRPSDRDASGPHRR